jgi:succinate dehydrogenase / fumarate reductase cytochrome b subunit
MSISRPTSPHLSVYRWLITNTLSIMHRMTGVGLVVGTLLVVVWLFSAAYHPKFYYDVQAVMSSLVGRGLMLGWTLAFFFHLGNGIRHLFWDAGYGFGLETVNKSGWAVLLFTVVMTAVSWGFVFGVPSDV